MQTLQQIFDNSLNGIRRQGKPGFGVGGCGVRPTCKYRTTDTSTGQPVACGIGQLIPDGVYVSAWDETPGGMSVGRLIAESGTFQQAMRQVGIDVGNRKVRELLGELQSAHDAAADRAYLGREDFMARFEANMRGVALRSGLTYTPATFKQIANIIERQL